MVAPRLMNLDGTALSWPELLARNERYWAMREEQEHFEAVQLRIRYYPNGSTYYMKVGA